MKIKRNRMDLPTVVGLASLLITIGSTIWIGGFRLSTLSHEVQDLKEDVREIRNDIEGIQTDVKEIRYDLHKMDIRVTTLEHHKR